MSNVKYQISNKKEKPRRLGYWILDIEYWKLPKGFTLVEMLVAVGIFAVMGAIIVAVLSFTLRGSKKSDSTEIIRQNGDAVLSRMVRDIRYAKSLDSPACVPSVESQEIRVTSLGGDITTFSCVSVLNTITKNSVSMVDTNTTMVQDCSFQCRQASIADMPTVTINFTLSSKDATGFFENKASIPFQTSVSMRNIK